MDSSVRFSGGITWQPGWGNYVTDNPVKVAELRDR